MRIIRWGRLRWVGHVAHMPEEEMSQNFLDGKLHQARGRGRQKIRWGTQMPRMAATYSNSTTGE